MDVFLGTWKMTKTEGFDEIMKSLGVGFIARTAGNTLRPSLVITSHDDGTYSMESVSTFKTTKSTFTLGQEFEESTPDSRHVKSIITLEGSTMKHVQIGDKTTNIERYIDEDGEMKTVVKVDDVVCHRAYTRA